MCSSLNSARIYPGQTDKSYPEVFNKIPNQNGVIKDEYSLNDEQLEQFFDKGYVLVKNVLTENELKPVINSINEMVENLADKLYKAGKIKNLYSDFGFNDRLTKLEKEFPGACVLAHKMGNIPESFCKVWSGGKLLSKVRQLLGAGPSVEIAGHPVWNLRTKVPNVEQVTVPWHQDAAYLDNDCYDVMQVTAWIPLLDVRRVNGCMQMAGYGQKSGKVFRHTGCWRGTWYIMLDEEELIGDYESRGIKMDEVTEVVEMNMGDILFFSNLIPHRSLDNTSDVIRWSLDLRWQDFSKPTGFYGLKDAVKMTSSSSGDADSSGGCGVGGFKVDWDGFNGVNRHAKAREYFEESQTDDFDTTIPGPWMAKWELVNRNKHTEAYEKMMRATNNGSGDVGGGWKDKMGCMLVG